MNFNRTVKLSALLLAVMVLTMAVYGFAAQNTVPASFAGDGDEDVSGFVVSDIHYTLLASDPSLVEEVTFTTTPAIPAGGEVYITLTGSTFGALDVDKQCTFSGATVTCDLAAAPVQVLLIENLRVIAAQ